MSATGQVIGIWELVSRVDRDKTGRVHVDPALGSNPVGMLCFSAERFAAQFSRRDRSDIGTDVPGASVSNNSAAVDGYDAYFGSYTLDEAANRLRVHLDASVARANIGKEFDRTARVEGHQLTVSLETNSASGVAITRVLTFRRLL